MSEDFADAFCTYIDYWWVWTSDGLTAIGHIVSCMS